MADRIAILSLGSVSLYISSAYESDKRATMPLWNRI